MMNKPTLLYVSPFWPQKSGISEYSEMLVPGMVELFDITVMTKGTDISNDSLKDLVNLKFYDPEEDYSQYDYIIYNFGNNPEYHDYMYYMLLKYSGYVIMHDVSLYYLAVDHYTATNSVFSEIYKMHGAKGICTIKEAIRVSYPANLLYIKTVASELLMNHDILQHAKGIFVHSDAAKNMVLDSLPSSNVKVINIVLPVVEYDKNRKQEFRKQYGLKEEDFVIGSIGYISNTKMNEEICLAVKRYNASHEHKIKYIMVGEGNYVDQYLDQYIIKTGFVEDTYFLPAIDSCDIIFNLRKLYNGESSYTLMQSLALGKTCIVSDIGWFSEFPDDCVCKLAETTEETIYDILVKKVNTELENEAGKEYVNRFFSKEAVAESIYHWMVS